MTRVQLKKEAKVQIKNKIALLFLISLTAAVIVEAAAVLFSLIPLEIHTHPIKHIPIGLDKIIHLEAGEYFEVLLEHFTHFSPLHKLAEILKNAGVYILEITEFGEIFTHYLILPVINLGIYRVYLSNIDGIAPKFKNMFSGLADWWKAVKVNFLMNFFTLLWSLLLVVPGIVKHLSYSMAPYVLAENKDLSARECMNRSKAITKGRLKELLLFDLSFVGWHLLAVLTMGIGYIWIKPYILAAFANHYRELALDYEEKLKND